MDLAIIWINSDYIVVDKQIALRWRPAYIPSQPACYVLELTTEWLNEFQIGDRIEFEVEAAK